MPELEPQPRAAAEYLRELLLRPGRYRRKWQQYSERGRQGRLNQLAVAEVLAHYLWEHPRTAGDADVLPRQLKDTTSRALSGALLSKQTLHLFMDAFDMADFERDQLMKLWEGSAQVRMLRGPGAMRPELVAEVAEILGPPGHTTMSLHDHMYVGAGRLPVRTRTLQVIEAIRPGLDRIPYIYDTNALSVTAGMGCSGLEEPLAQIADGVYVAYLLLANPLEAGDTLMLEYWTEYQYPDDYEGPDDTEYRRVVMRRVDNIAIRVQFDPDALPSGVWWAVWDTMQGGIVEEHEVQPDSQHAVQWFLSHAEKAVVGFHWVW